jgi:hypothetical protein
MKPTLLIIALFNLFILPILLTAQEPDHPFYIALSLGPSFPVGKYYMNDPDKGSYANPGVALTGKAGWYFNQHWGAELHFGEQLHPVDEQGMVADKLAADQFLETLSMKSDPWQVRNYMAGICFRTPLFNSFTIKGKAMGGAIWARTPEQFYGASFYGGVNYSYWVTSARDWAPSFLVGAALEYGLCDRVRVAVESDFIYGDTEFTFYTYTSFYQQKHRIRFVNTVLSVYYRL